MVPIPTNTWHEDMIDELYTSLLGKKYEENKDEDILEVEEQKTNENTLETDLNDLRIFG